MAELHHHAETADRRRTPLLLATNRHHLGVGALGEATASRRAGAIGTRDTREPPVGGVETLTNGHDAHELEIVGVRTDAEIGRARQRVGDRCAVGNEDDRRRVVADARAIRRRAPSTSSTIGSVSTGGGPSRFCNSLHSRIGDEAGDRWHHDQQHAVHVEDRVERHAEGDREDVVGGGQAEDRVEGQRRHAERRAPRPVTRPIEDVVLASVLGDAASIHGHTYSRPNVMPGNSTPP